jgi:hypothetical protein
MKKPLIPKQHEVTTYSKNNMKKPLIPKQHEVTTYSKTT